MWEFIRKFFTNPVCALFPGSMLTNRNDEFLESDNYIKKRANEIRREEKKKFEWDTLIYKYFKFTIKNGDEKMPSMFGGRNLIDDNAVVHLRHQTERKEAELNNSDFYDRIKHLVRYYEIEFNNLMGTSHGYTAPEHIDDQNRIRSHIQNLKNLLTVSDGVHSDFHLLLYCAKIGKQNFPFPYGYHGFSPYGYPQFCRQMDDICHKVETGEVTFNSHHQMSKDEMLQKVEAIEADRTRLSAEAQQAREEQRILVAASEARIAAMTAASDAKMDAMTTNSNAKIKQLDSKIASLEDAARYDADLLDRQTARISEQDSKLSEQDSKLSEQDSKLSEQDKKLSEQDKKLKSLESIKNEDSPTNQDTTNSYSQRNNGADQSSSSILSMIGFHGRRRGASTSPPPKVENVSLENKETAKPVAMQ